MTRDMTDAELAKSAATIVAKRVSRKPSTPRSRVKSALRQVWLRSRERAAAVKAQHNTCAKCGRKGSVAKGREVKIEVHHRHGIANWEAVINTVYEQILVDPSRLEVLCKECHAKEGK